MNTKRIQSIQTCIIIIFTFSAPNFICIFFTISAQASLVNVECMQYLNILTVPDL